MYYCNSSTAASAGDRVSWTQTIPSICVRFGNVGDVQQVSIEDNSHCLVYQDDGQIDFVPFKEIRYVSRPSREELLTHWHTRIRAFGVHAT